MKKSFALFVIFGVLTACQYEVTIQETPFKVSVQTYNAERVSAVNATLKAKADFGKSGPYGLEMGFQYSTSADIPASNSTTVEVENAEGTDVFSTVITGLDPLTTYYFRSFIRKDGQDTYGTIKTFTTMSLASLLTCFDAFLTGMTLTDVSLNAGLYLSDIVYSNLTYGFFWGQSNDPQGTELDAADLADNSYFASLTNLAQFTQYWYKAFVRLDGKTYYSDVKTFKTDGNHPVERISFETPNLPIQKGKDKTLSVTIQPDNATDKRLTWTSSDPAIATVYQTGRVIAKAQGLATITATAKDGSGQSANCTVTVYSIESPQAVDLGITVGGKTIKWASFNLGASTPEEFGLYYAWGETEPKGVYNWSTYKWCNGSNKTLTKYNPYVYYGSTSSNSQYGNMDGFRNFSECAYEDDAARVSLGGNWRTPTDEEWEALRKKCTWTWTTVNGVNGRMVKASNGNSIFLPAAGYISNTDNDSKLTKGYYWSFAVYPYIPYEALPQSFNAEHIYDSSYINRCSGIPIRPVTE